jgi:hypothetical protein
MELNTQVKAGIIGPNLNPADLPVNAHRRANARETSIRMSLKPLAKPPHFSAKRIARTTGEANRLLLVKLVAQRQ